ncbi:MAG: asparagine synthase (glutamine-hydrolyzing) [Spirochaetaceae bacterium]|nr:asparagine synthase (glutamine-hydrolyzing) [Spirochaetaceae bacterium]MCB9892760.1 asparagine synthase (glutamine-hydrolyzing) [Planctomycetota bacterium]
MCGICGIVDRRGVEVSERTLTRLRDSITHRGPDDAGIYRGSGAGLGSRRLAIIDLSPRGHMPMSNDDQSLWITYNGEIYNYRELRSELEGQGVNFRSDCDTEIVLRAFEHWGPDGVRHLHGMFAFAIWDESRKTLFAARDRLGVKPFHYIDDGDIFAFCSEPAGLYELHKPSFAGLDPLSLDFFLGFGYLPPDRSLVTGLNKLPPGHYMLVSQDGIRVTRYWQVEMEPTDASSVEEDLSELDRLLRRAVTKRLRSDVPLGCFLSGGIDSGLVTALAAEASDRPINTFCVGFAGARPEDDERALARIVADRFGTRHEELEVAAASHAMLPDVIRHTGEPFADVGILPMYQISRAARSHITVALSGDGGDESFAGYPNVASALRAERIRGSIPRPLTLLLEKATAIPPIHDLHPTIARANRFLTQYVNGGAVGQFDASNYWNGRWRDRLYTTRQRDARGDTLAASLIEAIVATRPNLRLPDLNLLVDLKMRLGGGYLTKVDIASSMVSLEVRSPFLDHELVEFAARLPIERKLLGGRQKGLLREYASRILPAEIVSQPKRGFAPGLDDWLRKEWSSLVEGLARRSRFASEGLFERATIDRVVREHLDGRADHGQRLWNLVCLETWAEVFLP